MLYSVPEVRDTSRDTFTAKIGHIQVQNKHIISSLFDTSLLLNNIAVADFQRLRRKNLNKRKWCFTFSKRIYFFKYCVSLHPV